MQILNAKFTNKKIHRPINSKQINGRHQLDVVNMKKYKIYQRGVSYNHILSVMDVFSRYVWLFPMSNKKSNTVIHHLEILYQQHGNPKIIQTDNGGEFTSKQFKKFVHDESIKHITSSPYNPGAQGKIERMHRTLRKMHRFDMFKRKANWVQSLPSYAKILNTQPKPVLSNLTPYEIYHSRKWGTHPSFKDPKKLITNRQNLYKKVSTATRSFTRKYIQNQLKNSKCPNYAIGQLVLYKYCNSKGGKIQSHSTKIAKVIEKNLKHSKYKIKYQNDKNEFEEKWVWVSKITIFRGKPMTSARAAAAQKGLQIKDYITLPPKKAKPNKFGQRRNINVAYDPPGDGSCLFGSVSHQLVRYGIYRSPSTLRAELVNFMRRTPTYNGGVHIQDLILNENWITYLNRLELSTTWADHYEIVGLAVLFNMRVIIFSTSGEDYDRVIDPPETEPMGTIYLGHYAEHGGLHFVSIQPDPSLPHPTISTHVTPTPSNSLPHPTISTHVTPTPGPSLPCPTISAHATPTPSPSLSHPTISTHTHSLNISPHLNFSDYSSPSPTQSTCSGPVFGSVSVPTPPYHQSASPPVQYSPSIPDNFFGPDYAFGFLRPPHISELPDEIFCRIFDFILDDMTNIGLLNRVN